MAEMVLGAGCSREAEATRKHSGAGAGIRARSLAGLAVVLFAGKRSLDKSCLGAVSLDFWLKARGWLCEVPVPVHVRQDRCRYLPRPRTHAPRSACNPLSVRSHRMSSRAPRSRCLRPRGLRHGCFHRNVPSSLARCAAWLDQWLSLGRPWRGLKDDERGSPDLEIELRPSEPGRRWLLLLQRRGSRPEPAAQIGGVAAGPPRGAG